MNENELYQSAMQAKAEGNKEKAIKILTELIDTFPDSSEAETARAVRYNLKEGDDYSIDSIPIEEPENQNVVVTDIQMPFGSMVVFMVKWAIASIPAIIILFMFFAIVTAIFGGIFGGSRY